MKKIVSVLMMLGITTVANATTIGQKLELLNDQNGSPRLGVQYAVGPDKLFSISFSVLGSQLVGNIADSIAPSKWAVIDLNTGNQLTPWADSNFGKAYVLPNSTQSFTLTMTGSRDILNVVSMLGTLGIAMSLKDARVVYVDLQDLCKSHPEKFVNLDTFGTGCE